MSGYDREYEAFRIFEQVRDERESPKRQVPAEKNREEVPSLKEEAPWYEIEYDSCPMPGVGRFVLKSQKVEAPVRDEVRKRFNQMRDIARKNQYLYYENSRFYDKRIRQENSKIFYEQGMFMKDFEDDCEKEVPFSAYFPSYQMMGYDQLRTYFTWRTRVRQGEIGETSTSYTFLYLYELLNQIGVENEQEGVLRLLEFWLASGSRQGAIGKYVLRWLKDYHIYYELPWTFGEFVEKNHLEAYYPELSERQERFELLCAISRYDIRKSRFYEERAELIKDCFHFVYERLEEIFAEKELDLQKMIFQPARNMPQWTPFKDALFYPAARQRDRRVVLSEKEIYLCSNGSWTFSTTLTTESGRRLTGFVMKQMEAALRKAVHYKYKISAGSPGSPEEEMLAQAGIDLEEAVTRATLEFYQESTKTVVEINPGALERIRQEALRTQEKLVVPEEDVFAAFKVQSAAQEKTWENPHVQESVAQAGLQTDTHFPEKEEPRGDAARQQTVPQQEEPENPWTDLKKALTETELEALLLIWKGEADLKQFADSHGVMLEVLAEGINEKAMDCVGDTLLDEEFAVYEDYLEQVSGMLADTGK